VGNPKEIDHLADQGVDGRVESEGILGRLVAGERFLLAQDRDRWRSLVDVAMNFRRLYILFIY
jgi:hypothetical protein